MQQVDIDTIKYLCQINAIRWTQHVLVRLLQRNISTDDVVKALLTGEIIESYPVDYPHPSCLVLGLSIKLNQLHVVCGIADSELWIITAYYPSPAEWEKDFKTRRREL